MLERTLGIVAVEALETIEATLGIGYVADSDWTDVYADDEAKALDYALRRSGPAEVTAGCLG